MSDHMRTGEAIMLKGDTEDGGGRRLSWLRLLKKQIERYTHGESSSVPLETAGSLLRSVLYTADLVKDSTEEKDPETLYGEGKIILARQFEKARRLYYLVKSTMLNIDSPSYREAVETGASAFFRAYDMEFAAQETPGDFDYPASIPFAGMGVSWMLHFLKTLYWENVFCRRFPESFVEGTLKARGIWGIAIPVNVFEPVFAAALHGYLLSEKPSCLIVHAADNGRLVQSLAPLPQEDVLKRVKEACEKLMEDMEIKSDPFRSLLKYQADALARRLVPALKHGNVDGVFPPWQSPPPPVLLMDGDPMADEDFRTFHAELSSCRYFSDKLLLLRRRVHSLYDLTGLMDIGCFSAKEVSRLFSMLGREELAALLCMGHGIMLMQGRWVFPDAAELAGDAPPWEKYLYSHLESLGVMRRREITDIAAQMQEAT